MNNLIDLTPFIRGFTRVSPGVLGGGGIQTTFTLGPLLQYVYNYNKKMGNKQFQSPTITIYPLTLTSLNDMLSLTF